MSTSLKLIDLEVGRVRWRFQAGWFSACAHLCDHLLTRTEADIWAREIPELVPLLASERSLFRAARELWRSSGISHQSLYAAWAARVRFHLLAAEELGWVWREAQGNDRCWLSPAGLFAVGRGGHVLSAYYPEPRMPVDFGCQEACAPSELAARASNPLPRQGRWLADGAEREERRRWRAEDAPGVVAFRVFRRSWKVVGSKALAAWKVEGKAFEASRDARVAARSMEVWERLQGAGHAS